MSDRFKLEEHIHRVWGVKEDIEDLLRRYSDAPTPMTEDEVFNYFSAIAHVLDLRCERLMDTFTQVFKLDHYRKEL